MNTYAFHILGLPNALGGYDETPAIMASLLKVSLNIMYIRDAYVLLA